MYFRIRFFNQDTGEIKELTYCTTVYPGCVTTGFHMALQHASGVLRGLDDRHQSWELDRIDYMGDRV